MLVGMRVSLFLILAASAANWGPAAMGAETNAPAQPAAVAIPAPAPVEKATPAAAAKPTAMTAEERAQYATLTRSELELTVQLKLLAELIREHLKRADESASTAAPEKAQWENDLAQEWRARSSAILAQLNEATKQRLVFEAAHAPAPPPAFGLLEDTKTLKPEEFAYLSKLDERMIKTREELAAIDEATRNLHAQLQTNRTDEATWRISGMFEENARQTRQLEKEMLDLELRRLEFRAIRK
jgi:hypothetical protein